MNNNFEDTCCVADSIVPQKYISPIKPRTQNTDPASSQFLTSSDSADTALFRQTNVVINSSSAITISTVETIAQWFLYRSPMSNKKLQKLCYYAYCWFIVFHNDIESAKSSEIVTLCLDKFQAWIHGPVCPKLYYKYRGNGWADIPQCKVRPQLAQDVENLLEQVMDAYGGLSADQLEVLSHTEKPWQNARIGLGRGEACTNEISPYDILLYYSSLG